MSRKHRVHVPWWTIFSVVLIALVLAGVCMFLCPTPTGLAFGAFITLQTLFLWARVGTGETVGKPRASIEKIVAVFQRRRDRGS